jgi:hypothetical protein
MPNSLLTCSLLLPHGEAFGRNLSCGNSFLGEFSEQWRNVEL